MTDESRPNAHVVGLAQLAVVALLLAACEKTGPVESSPGSGSSAPIVAPVIERGSTAAGTLATDAGVVAQPAPDAAASAPADAAIVAATPDAATRRPAPDDLLEAEARRIADLLTADDGSRVLDDLSSRRRPGADLGKQIEDVKSGDVTVRGSTGGAYRGPRGDAVAGPGPKIDPSAPTPPGRISVASKQGFDDTTLTMDLVLGKVQSMYMAGIKRCYKALLRQDPSARGRVRMTFTVNEAGRTMASRASGFAAAMDDCLQKMMPSWRFPIPRDGDGEVTDASFEIQLQFVPD